MLQWRLWSSAGCRLSQGSEADQPLAGQAVLRYADERLRRSHPMAKYPSMQRSSKRSIRATASP
jgi:hypothetical protein